MPRNKEDARKAANEWYKNNRERAAANKRANRKSKPDQYKAYTKRFRKSRRQALAEYKLNRGCSICGYKGHPDALHFDHLPGTDKKGQVSYMFAGKWEEILEEIAKCQVLCANCHAIETAARRREKAEIKRQEKESQQMRLRLA